ncbi:MAG: galactose mutarotase, partial [Pseudomonadota bacterium]
LTADAGPTLTIGTDAPGLQVYGGAGLPTVAGSLGAPIGPGAGLALEPQMWPDAPRHAAFPSILLPANQPWRQITTYHLDM